MDASHPPTAEAGAGFSGGPVPCPARKPRGSPLSHCLLGSQMPTPSRASFPLPCSPTAGSAPPPPLSGLLQRHWHSSPLCPHGKQHTLPDPFTLLHPMLMDAAGLMLFTLRASPGEGGGHCPRRQALCSHCLLWTSPSGGTPRAPPVEAARGATWQFGGLASPARVQSIPPFGSRGRFLLIALHV